MNLKLILSLAVYVAVILLGTLAFGSGFSWPKTLGLVTFGIVMGWVLHLITKDLK